MRPNADPAKAIEALQKNDYFAIKDETIVPIGLSVIGVKGIEAVVSGTGTFGEGENAKTEHVTIVYFFTAAQANTAWDKVKSYAEKEDDDSGDSDWTIAQAGRMIYYGTNAAIAAAR